MGIFKVALFPLVIGIVYQYADFSSVIDQLNDWAIKNVVPPVLQLFEENKLPDFVSRAGIDLLLMQRLHEEYTGDVESQEEKKKSFVAELKTMAIAEQTTAANDQHYEVSTSFYDLVLGPNKKYSSAYYTNIDDMGSFRGNAEALERLGEAEEYMFELYAERAGLKDNMKVLDLGCGWGSLSLWLAKRCPSCQITGLSNSHSQKKYILDQAQDRGLNNVQIITTDINEFHMPEEQRQTFDLVFSIEMFEHMKNYELLLRKISKEVLKPKIGKLFVHIFVHKEYPYHFLVKDESDWMAKFFFSGGTMPSVDLLSHFQDDLSLKDHWRVNGKHYAMTLEAWLLNIDNNTDALRPALAEIYKTGDANSAGTTMWLARWRAFMLSCSELFAFNDGNEWFVAHYLFQNH